MIRTTRTTKEWSCPYCGQKEAVIKSGLNSTGSQRYKCRACRRYFTPQQKPKGYDDEVREQAVQLYLEGASLRSIGRLLHVHHQSVSNWINAHAHSLPKQVDDTEPSAIVEVDELFTYVGKKTGKST